MSTLRNALGVAALVCIATTAQAGPIPLSPSGELFNDPVFTATGNQIIGYYYGATAGYASEIFVIVDPGGANYVGPTAFYRGPGAEISAGTGPQVLFDSALHAGGADIRGMNLVFGLRVWTDGRRDNGEAPNYTLYSTHSMHNPPVNANVRAYATEWSNNITGNVIPGSSIMVDPASGAIYVGFEDQLNSVPPDFDYDDHQFIFVGLNAHTPTTVPEPSTWAMMFTGVAGLALGVWRRRQAMK